MALTPIEFDVVTAEDSLSSATESTQLVQPSKTWHLDLENGRIRTQIDDLEAIRQSIRKALTTARYRYLIYDDQYGDELHDLLGQELTHELINTEIPALVREALSIDDRIESVESVQITEYNRDSFHIAITVELYDGRNLTEEVTIA